MLPWNLPHQNHRFNTAPLTDKRDQPQASYNSRLPLQNFRRRNRQTVGLKKTWSRREERRDTVIFRGGKKFSQKNESSWPSNIDVPVLGSRRKQKAGTSTEPRIAIYTILPPGHTSVLKKKTIPYCVDFCPIRDAYKTPALPPLSINLIIGMRVDVQSSTRKPARGWRKSVKARLFQTTKNGNNSAGGTHQLTGTTTSPSGRERGKTSRLEKQRRRLT